MTVLSIWSLFPAELLNPPAPALKWTLHPMCVCGHEDESHDEDTDEYNNCCNGCGDDGVGETCDGFSPTCQTCGGMVQFFNMRNDPYYQDAVSETPYAWRCVNDLTHDPRAGSVYADA